MGLTLLVGTGETQFADESPEEERFAVAMIPPLAAGVGLVPPVADARFAGAAIVEEAGDLARPAPTGARKSGPRSIPSPTPHCLRDRCAHA